MREFPARCIYRGRIQGEALVGMAPLSFWGGVDAVTGEVIDVHHDLCGQKLTGRVLCLPRGAGSSSGCGVLMEMVRAGTEPLAIVNIETEAVLALGPIISQELYGKSFPMVTVDACDFGAIKTGDIIEVVSEAEGSYVRIICNSLGETKPL